MRRVLITGAGGFLGGVLCDVLAERGNEVVAHQREAMSPQRPGMAVVTFNLTDTVALSAIPEVDAIFHCAARRPRSYDDEEAAENNRRIDDAVLSFAGKRRLDLIFASMATLYGMGAPCPPGPATGTKAGIYPLEKARTEEAGLDQAARLGTRFSSLRINAPYGPGQAARTVMQIFIGNALSGRPLTYHGSGSRQQDFTYGRDIAEAFLLALTSPSGRYMISGGTPVTMRELALAVCKAASAPATLVQASGKPDPQDGMKAQFDISETARVLGWRPQTPLPAGIEACIADRKKQSRS